MLLIASARSAFADEQPERQEPSFDADSPPLVVDLDTAKAGRRASRRARITAALGQHPTLEASSDAELDAALRGELPLAALTRGIDAAEAAHEGSIGGRCAEALASAQIARLDLAGAQAAGAEVTPALVLVYGARFRCAVKAKDTASALAAAHALRRLGQIDPPAGVEAVTWQLHPELDAAANVGVAEITINSEPAGAEVWIDHARRGVAPITAHVNQGSHLIAVATGSSIAAKSLEVTSWSHVETLSPKPSVGRWTRVNEQVAALRSKHRGADATAIGEVMATAGASSALVLLPGGTTEVWRVAHGGLIVRVGRRRSEAQAVALLGQGASSRAPDPNIPLLRETEAERLARENQIEPPAKWWVYAAVIGAAAVGAGVIVFGQAGTDRQRFEITLP